MNTHVYVFRLNEQYTLTTLSFSNKQTLQLLLFILVSEVIEELIVPGVLKFYIGTAEFRFKGV